MKVLVSKINPKEIEEKIAKAESVTQTLYKKESNLKMFESVTSFFCYRVDSYMWYLYGICSV